MEMFFLRVMVKRSRGKKHQEETEKQQHVIVTESSLFKGLLQKVFKITTESSPASLTATVDCAADHVEIILRLSRHLQRSWPEIFQIVRNSMRRPIKLAGLHLVVILNTFCSKTYK